MSGFRRGVRAGLLLCALLPAASTQPKVPPPAPAPAHLASPQVLFKDLFVAVQSEALYQDGKTFVDAVPKAAPGEILAQYHHARPSTPEALRQFVAAHFDLPA